MQHADRVGERQQFRISQIASQPRSSAVMSGQLPSLTTCVVSSFTILTEDNWSLISANTRIAVTLYQQTSSIFFRNGFQNWQPLLPTKVKFKSGRLWWTTRSSPSQTCLPAHKEKRHIILLLHHRLAEAYLMATNSRQ